MTEDLNSSANIEWKQDASSISKKTRTTRRIDEKKISLSDKKNNKLDIGLSKFGASSGNLKKIRKKIKDIFDEDDDEENDFVFTHNPLLLNNSDEDKNSSLVESLNADEKQQLITQQTIKNQDMQRSSKKMGDILNAQTELKNSGIKKMDNALINDTMINIATDEKAFDITIQKQVKKSTNVKIRDSYSRKEIKDFIKGLKKVQKSQEVFLENDKKLFEKLKSDDFIDIGKEKNDQKIAQTIIEKTGRDNKNKQTTNNKEKEKKAKNVQNKVQKIR